MPITYRNSPIVELIAELHWDVAKVVATGPAPALGMVADTGAYEEFFMRFTGPAFANGYAQIERVVPHGFPMFAHQPAVRFRPKEGNGLLLQIGPGLLTINATQPYKNWDAFAPEIRKGIEALFSARSDVENAQPFTAVNLRYVDGFNVTHTQGQNIGEFLRNVLGIDVRLPEAVTKHAATGRPIKPTIQVQVPMTDDRVLSLGVGDGMVNGQPVFVMDTTISAQRPIEPDVESLMQEFASARGVIHEMFFEMTTSIRELMQPEGEE